MWKSIFYCFAPSPPARSNLRSRPSSSRTILKYDLRVVVAIVGDQNWQRTLCKPLLRGIVLSDALGMQIRELLSRTWDVPRECQSKLRHVRSLDPVPECQDTQNSSLVRPWSDEMCCLKVLAFTLSVLLLSFDVKVRGKSSNKELILREKVQIRGFVARNEHSILPSWKFVSQIC